MDQPQSHQNVLTMQAYATAGEGPKWAGLDAATIAARVAAQVTAESASIRAAGWSLAHYIA